MNKIPLLYRDRREEGETVLRQAQLVQLHILHVFHRICEEHNLTYFLLAGTALGAARHGGFIPWDDDLDVAMPRKDYKKFRKIAATVLPDDLTAEDTGLLLPFMKVRDRYSFFYEACPDKTMADCSGIYMDIFPLDYYPSKCFKLWEKIQRICHKTWRHSRKFRVATKRNLWKGLYALPLALLSMIVSQIAYGILWSAQFLFDKKIIGLCYNMGNICYFNAADVFPPKRIRFEDDDFWGFQNIEAVLDAQYGAWREIPPPEKRPRHAMIIHPMETPHLTKWAMNYKKATQK